MRDSFCRLGMGYLMLIAYKLFEVWLQNREFGEDMLTRWEGEYKLHYLASIQMFNILYWFQWTHIKPKQRHTVIAVLEIF